MQIYELGSAIDPIVFEVSLQVFSIFEHDSSITLFEVIFQLALIVEPLFLEFFEVGVVEGVIEHRGIVVKDLSVAMELVVFPVSLVGEVARAVIKSAVAVHAVP